MIVLLVSKYVTVFDGIKQNVEFKAFTMYFGPRFVNNNMINMCTGTLIFYRLQETQIVYYIIAGQPE